MGKKRILNYLNLYKSFGIEYCEPINLDKKFIINHELPNTIENLDSYVQHCSLCELSKNCNMRSLGTGNIHSNIYIVGINSDFTDEHINTVLKNIVQNVLEYKLEDVYLTNLIKCNIKSINKSINENINLCKEYFIKQIDIIKPKYIITLGEAFNYLMENNQEISNISGNSYNYNDSKLLPLMDLEFIYKNPSYKQDMYKDLQKIKLLMEKE